MARSSYPTVLSVSQYAMLMGINPAHFAGGAAGTIFPLGGSCNQVWYQYSWQAADRVAREDLGLAIFNAEQEIAQVLGYWPAPRWFSQEFVNYPRYYDPTRWRTSGLDASERSISARLRYGRIIAGGRRSTTAIGTATASTPAAPGDTLVYSDADGDGYQETATITLPVPSTMPHSQLIKAYWPGQTAPEWEIRPTRTKTLSGGSVVMKFWSWQLVPWDRWEQFPSDTYPAALDFNDPVNRLSSVDVLYEYNDPTAVSARFRWEASPRLDCACGGVGCALCSFTAQDGCILPRDANAGTAALQPATYSGGAWSGLPWSLCRDPDHVSVWYYAGAISEEYLSGQGQDPLSRYLAEAIAWLATARLERPFCACSNLVALAADLRIDLAATQPISFQVSGAQLDNPFGTRRGEVKAWRRIAMLSDALSIGFAV